MLTRNAATLASGRPHLDLLSAVTLPTGGVVCVDLFRLNLPLYLFLGSAELADDAVWRLAHSLEDESASVAADVELPESWVRLAVVNGVDRWYEEPLDESLLAADRALALHEAGDEQSAHAIFASPDLRLRLDRFANEVAIRIADSSIDGRAAIVTELLRVLDAAPREMRVYAKAAHEVRNATAGGDTELWAYAADSSAESKDSDLHSLEFRSGLEMKLTAVDRLRVPARLIKGFQVGYLARDGEDFVDITCAPFPGITADHPASSRLLVSVHDTNGRILSAGALELDDEGMFAARLPLHGRTLEQVTVEVYDSRGLHESRSGSLGQPARDALAQAQRAFTDLRISLSRSAFGYRDFTDFVRAAERALDTVHHEQLSEIAAGYRAEVSAGTCALLGLGGARPLLTELHAGLEPEQLAD